MHSSTILEAPTAPVSARPFNTSKHIGISKLIGNVAKISLFLISLASSNSQAIEINIQSDTPGIIKDAVLIASTSGQCPVRAVALGDIDFSESSHTVQTEIDQEFDSWWLVGHIDGEITYSSNVDLLNANLHESQPFNGLNAQSNWPVASIIEDLKNYNAQAVKFRFGVMADTHYYSEPLGTPHPIEQAAPLKYDLPGNLNKMAKALDDFSEEDVSFATLLGDMVEDHKSYPAGGSFIANGALTTNMEGLQNLFDGYSFPIRIAVGNHDRGAGTSRTDLIENLSYYAQEMYDGDDSANRMDYVFDIQDLRFIVYDNVNQLPGANKGFRSASLATLQFLETELAKISNGGVDEGKPVIIMAHARVDCLATKGCQQKIDLTDGSYQWTPSNGGENEYYLELAGGGSPNLPGAQQFNRFLWLENTGMPHGSIGLLDPGEWNYGKKAEDSIAFDTVYVRLDDSTGADPDDANAGTLHYKVVSAGAAENFEEIRAIFTTAHINGANIRGVLQGHNHINDYNVVDGIEYFSFKSLKVVPVAHAIVEVLHDNNVHVRGFGDQETYKFRTPKEQYYACGEIGPNAFSPLWGQLLANHDGHTLRNIAPGTLWQFNTKGVNLGALSVDLRNSGIVYEDAEDGKIDGWSLFDASPPGATIKVAFDHETQSNVIELNGDGWSNGYELRNPDYTDWKNTSAFVINWKMNFDETYIIVVKVNTNVGSRYLRYTATDSDALGTGTTVNFGLNTSSKNGDWLRVTRDLRADLAMAQPTVKILSVDSLRVRGSGRLDDIKLYSKQPPLDADGDGLSDVDEINIYGTNDLEFDSDSDGISDSGELSFWGKNWNVDFDNDGLLNLQDIDADGDGIADGVEIALGLDPADIASIPATTYEDAEDGDTLAWEVFDNSPAGASITNVFDETRQSRVIRLSGDTWSNGYRLGSNNLGNWGNKQQFVAQWSMSYSEHYIVIFKVSTTAGTRYLRYEPKNSHGLGNGRTIFLGMGAATTDGQWRTYYRDLQADLRLADQSGVTITAVQEVLFRGSGRVDDILLHSHLPMAADNDQDGLLNTDEIFFYGTDENQADSDNDGINDGAELLYWAQNWSADIDNDGLSALLDIDSDGDTFTDGQELDAGADPSDFASKPPTIYEDAESGTIAGWDIFDSDPAGANIKNVFDATRNSRVVEFSGTNWRNGYRLRNDDYSAWNNTEQFIAHWSMNFNELYVVTIRVATSAGTRYLRYDTNNTDRLGSQRMIYFGLGSNTKDGQWHSFSRDLQADLSRAQPGVVITAVHYIQFRGSGRVDDISLSR